MAFLQIRCPSCQNTDVIQHGRTAQGKQRYRCQHPGCPYHTFLVEYSHHGRWPEVTQPMLEMTLNGRGIRDIARGLHISPTTVIEELKKEPQLQHINNPAIHHRDPREISIEIHKVDEVEVDEMWSFVGKQTQQRWLWHAMDHRTGVVVAYVLGTHQDEVFIQLKAL